MGYLKSVKNKTLSIPSIPSRYLTPVLRFDLYERDGQQSKELEGYQVQNDRSLESVLVAKVARLTNDGSALGPGSYNIAESSRHLQKSPKGSVNWVNSKSKRDEHFIKTFTQRTVGPGSYQNNQQINRSINNPTIPR